MKFPVFDRKCGTNVFDWILITSEEVRQRRQLEREMHYRQLLAEKELEAHGKLFAQISKAQGQGSKPAPTVKKIPAGKVYRAGQAATA